MWFLSTYGGRMIFFLYFLMSKNIFNIRTMEKGTGLNNYQESEI